MSDRSSMLNDTGDSSQFIIWGVASFILHAFIVAGMFYLPELNIPEIKPTVVTIDLSAMPSLEPPAKKKGSLPKASPAPEKPSAESGDSAEKEEAPKGDVEKAPPPKPKPKPEPEPEPKKETPPPPHKEQPKPEPKVEEKKPKEAPKKDVISSKPKKEDKKEEKKEPKEEKPEKTSEVKNDKKDAKEDKSPPDKEAKEKEPKKDGKVGEKDGSDKSDALARMRKKAALKAAANKAAAGDGEGDGGEEGDPRGSEKGSIHGVEGGSTKGGASASVDTFYLHEIGRYLAKNWIFSDALKGTKGLETSVVLKILPDGSLKEPPFFEKRSGNSFFDDTVYRAIMKSVPFPGFPQGIKEPFVIAAYRFTPDGIK